MELHQKKEMILNHEFNFAYAVASAAIMKPKASPWIILLPFMFIFLIHDMIKFNRTRRRFTEEFMSDRHHAMSAAVESVRSNSDPKTDWIVKKYDDMESLKKFYCAWIGVLVEHYIDLLSSVGADFKALVRSTYRNRTNYLLALNRLNTVEKEFFEVLKNSMKTIEGASSVITVVQSKSQSLRRNFAEQVFA